MIKIANGIMDKNIDLILRRKIAVYTEKIQFYIKVSSLKEIDNTIDICFLDLEHFLHYEKELQQYPNIIIVLILEADSQVLLAPFGLYYINKYKIDNQLFIVLDKIIKEVKIKNIIASIPNKGEKKLLLAEINFIDINNRNLGYHMTNNTVIKGKTIRASFEQETKQYSSHKELYLIKPSFMINIANINELYPDHIVFQSGESLYFPKTAYQALKEKWLNI